MDELKQQLANVEQQITEEKAKGAGRDTELITTLENKQAEILLKMDEETKRAAQELIIEEHVSQDITFFIEGVDMSGIPSAFINLAEKIVRYDRKQNTKAHLDALDERDAAHQAEKTAMLGTIAEQKQENENLQGIISNGKAANASLVNENGNLRDHIAQVNLDVEDLRSKLANAAAQLDEKDAAIKQLTSQVDDYQKAKVYGEVEAQKVIDITPESSEANDINAAVAALKTYISVENFGSINKVVVGPGEKDFVLVKNTELEKEWVPAEATTFPEAPTLDTQDGRIPATAIEPPALPSETEVPDMDHTVGGESIDPAVATVTRAEFEELKQRVAGIEAGRLGVVA